MKDFDYNLYDKSLQSRQLLSEQKWFLWDFFQKTGWGREKQKQRKSKFKRSGFVFIDVRLVRGAPSITVA